MKTINNQGKFLVVFFFVLLFINQAFGQTNLQKAQQMVAFYEYQKAIDLYNAHFKTNTPTIDDARALAECYIMVNYTEPATEWMAKVVAFNEAKPSDILIYARLLKSGGKYQEAISQFQAYKSIVPSESEKADKWILACENSIKWIEKPEYFDVSNAEMFNSGNSEFGLIPFNKGYIFTSDRRISGVVYSKEDLYGWTGNPYLKLYSIYVSEDGKSIIKMKSMDELNYKYHNGPGTFNTKEQNFYYTRTKMVKVTKKPINSDPTSWYDYSTAAEYTNRLEIYFSKYSYNNWTETTAFPYNKPEDYSVGHPALSPDGKILYFVSNMPGGFGGSDIYYCEKTTTDTWGTPQNAGNIINTEGEEVFPFMDANGTLFYSSDGHPGMGGLDLFSTKGSKNSWSTPKNLKYPLNSPKDDFSIYYTVTDKAGYLASNRDMGKGADDIYSFVESLPINLILAVVTKERNDDNTLSVLQNVNIDIKNITTENIQKVITDTYGTSYSKADCETSYEITGTKDGYFTNVKDVVTKCVERNDTIFVELILNKIIIDKPIVLRNIYYDFDKYNIRPDAAVELDKLVLILKQNPQIIVELGSHTDCRGSFKYNEVLATNRAESAVSYIISNGIGSDRITAKGYGELILVNQCADNVKCTDEEHQMNRRTEFKVTGYKGKISVIK